MNQLHYTKNEPFKRAAYYSALMENGTVIGSLEQEVDGYYYFYPSKIWANGGCVPGWILNDLSRKLGALNEAWDQHLHSALEACTEYTPNHLPKP